MRSQTGPTRRQTELQTKFNDLKARFLTHKQIDKFTGYRRNNRGSKLNSEENSE